MTVESEGGAGCHKQSEDVRKKLQFQRDKSGLNRFKKNDPMHATPTLGTSGYREVSYADGLPVSNG